MERCCQVTEEVLQAVFDQLDAEGVMLEGIILKPNMVLPGLSCAEPVALNDIADTTVKCLLRVVPGAVAGVAFLSGGQDCKLASARLCAMNLRFRGQLPWPLTFSFARAIQQPALEIWLGAESNVVESQRALLHRAQCNSAARSGQYNAAMEKI